MLQRAVDYLEQKDYPALKRLLNEMEPADIALLFDELEKEDAFRVFRILPKELAADAFVEMDPDMQEALIKTFSDNELKEVMDELYMDDTVDIIEEMPANVVRRMLRNFDSETRRTINKLLKYPDDSAGSIMTVEYVSLKAFMTVQDAFTNIRRTGIDKETIYTCYVTDANRVLEGVVTAKTLLLSDENALISDIMETNVIYVETHEDKEDVAKQFDKYDFLALPVVDKEKRLVGIITIDDAIDVLQEENTEDFEKMAAMLPSEDSYFKTGVLKHAKNRIIWLLVLMLSATFTGYIITNYENAFAAVPLLVSFIPMLMDTGGNCGAQASTMIIRGMALDEIKLKDFFKVWWKEIRIAVLIGISLAIVNTGRVLIMHRDFAQPLHLSLVLGLTLMGTVAIAKTLGCSLPMIAKKLKVDPAIMASPMITTIVDACSVLLYFNIALKVLDITL